jgi:hypothetical protein
MFVQITIIGIPLHTITYDDKVDLPAPQLVNDGNLLLQCFRKLCSICAFLKYITKLSQSESLNILTLWLWNHQRQTLDCR